MEEIKIFENEKLKRTLYVAGQNREVRFLSKGQED